MDELADYLEKPAAREDESMHELQFLLRERSDLGGALEVVPTIDGAELLDLVHTFEKNAGMETRDLSYGGLIPALYRFGSWRTHYFTMDKAVPVLGCACGEWACWPLLISVELSDNDVVWTSFEQPFRKERDYSAFGPFRFRRTAYTSALDQLEGLTSD